MKNIGLLVFIILLIFVPKTLTAQIQSILIDSTEYTYFAFPIVYDEVDEFEGVKITHTSRVDSWVINPESGAFVSLWLTKIDDLIILNALTGFNACVSDDTNLLIRLKSDEIVELHSLNDIECGRLKILRYEFDEESISKIINSRVETVRISTTEGNIDYKPQFAEDLYQTSREYHERKLNDPNATNKSYYRERLEELEIERKMGYTGNTYALVHITAPKFETVSCQGRKAYEEYDMGDYHGLLDDTFRKYDVNSCKELI